MHPTFVLLVGVAIVICGVLLLRLHAFLALVLAAVVVGLLTPRSSVEGYWIGKNRLKIESTETASPSTIRLHLDTSEHARVGMRYVVLRRENVLPETERREWAWSVINRYNANENEVLEKSEWSQIPFIGSADTDRDGRLTEHELAGWRPTLRPVAELEVTSVRRYEDAKGEPQQEAEATHVGPRYAASLGPQDIVIHPLQIDSAVNRAKQTVGERVATEFGNTCAKIGILIAMAAIIGKCLLDSGAADRIVRASLKLVGERGAPVAFVGSGFLLGVPVFFDTVFYLMMPLGKALRMRTGRNYVLYVLTIVAGATMAHSLVPPTPGPLFVAEELRVDLGLMIIAGCIVGLFTATAGLLFALLVNRYSEVPLRESPDFSLAEIEEISRRDVSQLPSLWLSLAPIVLPVILIAGYTVVESFELIAKDSPLMPVAATLGNKNIALGIATIIALATLVHQKRTSLRHLSESIQAALASGGVIILITAGGGAFGGMLQQTGVASLIEGLPGNTSSLVVIALAFLVTTAIRTAQGSATVAMITAVGILAGFATSGSLGCDPVYLALAIGCGSKPIAWMNDSGFWVICKMSGMTEGEGLRFVTPMSMIMGVVGLGITMLGATFLPLI